MVSVLGKSIQIYVQMENKLNSSDLATSTYSCYDKDKNIKSRPQMNPKLGVTLTNAEFSRNINVKEAKIIPQLYFIFFLFPLILS